MLFVDLLLIQLIIIHSTYRSQLVLNFSKTASFCEIRIQPLRPVCLSTKLLALNGYPGSVLSTTSGQNDQSFRKKLLKCWENPGSHDQITKYCTCNCAIHQPGTQFLQKRFIRWTISRSNDTRWNLTKTNTKSQSCPLDHFEILSMIHERHTQYVYNTSYPQYTFKYAHLRVIQLP